PGNRYSIGIEMCEHEGDDRAQTLERTAKLAASLMYYHNIPIENIRAHYHWPRAGYSTPNKNCPHFLLEGGMPGPTWRWFVGRINQHHQRLELYQQEQQEKQLEEERRRKAREMVLRAITRLTDWVAFRVS
ncbi:MAG: N-acetylmuramoyl-L-alanine amidase, partial [Verrucomicrobiota bacterium]